MRLILSSRHPRNSTYTTEDGHILYKVDKPHTLGHGTATIKKAVGTVNGIWQGGSLKLPESARSKSPKSEKSFSKEQSERGKEGGDRESVDGMFEDSDSEGEAGPSTVDLPVLEGHFAFYAQVEFHSFSSSRFRYNSMDVSVSDYFRKEGWSWFGRGRVFKASDGKEYRWELRVGHLEMIRNDGSKEQVVRFREWRPSLGPVMKGRPASLEIHPSCVPILDEIMMTFIYCHKLRKDRERSQRSSGGGGGGGGGG